MTITPLDAFPERVREALDLPEQGLVVTEDLQRIVFAKEAGDVVRLRLWQDGNVRDLDVTLRSATTDIDRARPDR